MTVVAVSPEAWSAIGSITVAAVAVLIALFQEPISRFHRRANLTMQVSQEDFRQARLFDVEREIYVGGFGLLAVVRVEHVGGGPARAVEIVVNDVRSAATGIWLSHFFPMSLAVSFVRPKASTAYVTPGSYRFFDLGTLRTPSADEGEALPETKGKFYFWFAVPYRPTPSSPNFHPNQLPPGTYDFELLLTGENVKRIKKRWRLQFTDESSKKGEMIVPKGSLGITPRP